MANTYPTTQFPLGSTEVKVLYNNASNLDDAVNSAALTWTDRFGLVRKSMSGIESDAANALLNTGFEFIGDYDADGPLTITRFNQTFTRAGEFWRPGPSIVLPFTTTGVWATDEPNFVMNGDASLRTALAASGPLNGAAMINRNSQVVDSFDALGLLSKTAPSKFAFATAHNVLYQGVGGGHYRLDSSDTISPEVKGICKVAADGGRWKLIHDGKVNIEQMGCVGVPGVNNFTDLQAAITYGYDNHITIIAGSGTYEYGTTLDLGYPQLCFFGSGFRNTVFKFTGTGRAMDALGGRPNNGAYSFDIDLADFTIEGNANATDLFRCRLNHPRIRNVNAREASSVNGCGFRLEGPVVGFFENLTCSTNTQLMTNRPYLGLVVDADPTDGRRATANTFINPVIEGTFGDGVIFAGCDANVVTGGTSENNGGNGITIAPGCQMNTFIGFDCEANLGYADFYESGSFNKFINCGSHHKFYIDNSSVSSSIEGGWHDEFEIGAGAVYPEISRVKVRFFGGAVAFTSNGNPFFSVKQMYDVQLGAYIFPAKTVTTITVPLGDFTYTNGNAFSEDIVITGGTFSTLMLNRGAVAFVAALPLSGMFTLQPGDGLTFGTVSVAPTVHRIPNGLNFA
jgi:hypothetical protein